MNKKIKIRDKFFSESRPRTDLDYIEVSVAPEDLDTYVRTHSKHAVIEDESGEPTYLIDRKRREGMLEEVYKTAAKVLTDRQFQVFIMRYKFGLKETEIARQASVDQGYVSVLLRNCHKKIRIAMNLQQRRKLKPRGAPVSTSKKHRKNTPRKKNKKKS